MKQTFVHPRYEGTVFNSRTEFAIADCKQQVKNTKERYPDDPAQAMFDVIFAPLNFISALDDQNL